MRHYVLAATVMVAVTGLAAPARAAGNFEFAVPGEAGLTMEVTGYQADGSQMFQVRSTQLEQGFYVVRVDETIITSNRLARWCVEDASGQWSALAGHPGATTVCDDKPSETRGRYLFKPGTVLEATAPAEAPKLDVPEMSLADASACVQKGLNTLGFDAGPVDGQMGRRTDNAALSFAGLQDARYPTLSGETAAEWCVRLEAAIADGSGSKARAELGQFQFGPDVDASIAGDTQRSLAEIHAYFVETYGAALANPGTIYVSSDPEWMADRYVAQIGAGSGVRRGKVKNFADCNGGEAGHGFMFMCTKSEVFTGDWFGAGRAAQRTFALTHEYFHMLQFERGGDRPLGPHWLIEGAAEYTAFRILRDSGRMTGFDKEIDWHTQKAAEVASSLKQMENRDGFYAEARASSSGMIAAHLLAERAGLPALAAFYGEIGGGKRWEAAFETAFGLTPTDFYEAYEARIH